MINPAQALSRQFSVQPLNVSPQPFYAYNPSAQQQFSPGGHAILPYSPGGSGGPPQSPNTWQQAVGIGQSPLSPARSFHLGSYPVGVARSPSMMAATPPSPGGMMAMQPQSPGGGMMAMQPQSPGGGMMAMQPQRQQYPMSPGGGAMVPVWVCSNLRSLGIINQTTFTP